MGRYAGMQPPFSSFSQEHIFSWNYWNYLSSYSQHVHELLDLCVRTNFENGQGLRKDAALCRVTLRRYFNDAQYFPG